MAAGLDAALLQQIEDAGLNASAVPQQRLIDGWLVRYAPGKPKRARCINAIAPGRRGFEQRLGEASALYAAAGLPTVVRITPFSQPNDLDRVLAGRGWARFDETIVMVLAELRPSGAGRDPATCLERVDTDTFSRVAGRLRGVSADHQNALARRLADSPVPYLTFASREGNQVVACGALAIESEAAGIYEVVVADTARRRGHAMRLCSALLDHAPGLGARRAYLQVDAANVAAVALYRTLGFSDAYRYHYRAPDPSTA